MVGKCNRCGNKNAYVSLVNNPEWKREVERPTQRWDNYIKRKLKDMGCGWI
jgi:hypothetical protein